MKNRQFPSLSRRQFLSASASLVFSAPLIVPASALGRVRRRKAANDRIQMACIGVGGRGQDDMKAFLRETDAQIVAVCDVRKENASTAQKIVEERYAGETARGNYSGCKVFSDFRELLRRNDVDAVSITTPDHWHVPIGIAAVKAGMDVFIEKPLSYTIEEGRLMCKAVKKYNRVFQHGTQQRTGRDFRFACELVRNEKIGKLQSIEVGSPSGITQGNQPPAPVPANFNYEMWLGASALKPYDEMRTVTPWWYHISDYTIGYVAGWGVHHIDIAQWGNNTDNTGPVEIEGFGEFPKEGLCDTATGWDITLKYANGIPLHYTDEQRLRHGVRFIGSDGWVHVTRETLEAEPKSLLETQWGPNDIHLYEAPNLQQNFLECIRSRKETICPVETAHRSTTICHLSQILMKLGRKLTWDPEKEQFVNDDEANTYLRRSIKDPAFDFDYYSL